MVQIQMDFASTPEKEPFIESTIKSMLQETTSLKDYTEEEIDDLYQDMRYPDHELVANAIKKDYTKPFTMAIISNEIEKIRSLLAGMLRLNISNEYYLNIWFYKDVVLIVDPVVYEKYTQEIISFWFPE